MRDKDYKLKKLLRTSSIEAPPNAGDSVREKLTEDQKKLYDDIMEGYLKSGEICDSKVKIAERALMMVRTTFLCRWILFR